MDSTEPYFLYGNLFYIFYRRFLPIPYLIDLKSIDNKRNKI